MKRSIPVLIAIFLTAGCATSGAQRKTIPAAPPASGMIGGIVLTDAPQRTVATPDKVVLATFEFTAAGVTPRDALIAYGHSAAAPSGGNDYRIELATAESRPLASYTITDPRKQVVEKQGLVRVDSASHTARFGFTPRAAAIRILDPAGNVLATAPLATALERFCANNRKDGDCGKR